MDSRRKRAKRPGTTMHELPSSFRESNREGLEFLRELLKSGTINLPLNILFERHRESNSRLNDVKKKPQMFISKDENKFLFSMKFDYCKFPMVLEFTMEQWKEAMETTEEILAKNFLTFDVRTIEQLRAKHIIGF